MTEPSNRYMLLFHNGSPAWDKQSRVARRTEQSSRCRFNALRKWRCAGCRLNCRSAKGIWTASRQFARMQYRCWSCANRPSVSYNCTDRAGAEDETLRSECHARQATQEEILREWNRVLPSPVEKPFRKELRRSEQRVTRKG